MDGTSLGLSFQFPLYEMAITILRPSYCWEAHLGSLTCARGSPQEGKEGSARSGRTHAGHS